MKIKGNSIPAPKPVKVKFFRGSEIVELLVQAVLSYEQFDRLVPHPKPPLVTVVKENRQYHNYDDKAYLRSVDRYSQFKSHYIILKGLEATEGLEWDTVKMDEPDTWGNYKTDLLTCFTEMEVSDIIDAINEANHPTGRRLEEAFDSFTSSQAQPVAEPVPSSQPDGQPATASGDPVNASA